MKRLAIGVAILAIGVTGCGGGSSNPTSPSDITVFTVPLSAQNEVPPITNAEKDATGTAVITIHRSTNTIDFNVSLAGFTPTSAVNIAHIHGPNGAAGQIASVLVSTTLAPGNVNLVNGAGTFSFPAVQTTEANVTQILANPRNFYFNVHTQANGNGAIRGQLAP